MLKIAEILQLPRREIVITTDELAALEPMYWFRGIAIGTPRSNWVVCSIGEEVVLLRTSFGFFSWDGYTLRFDGKAIEQVILTN